MLLFFAFLAGYNESVPLNEVFYISFWLGDVLKARANAPVSSSGQYHWTPWSLCAATNGGKNVNCTSHDIAFAFNPNVYFTGDGLSVFNDSFYYDSSRAVAALFIITIIFTSFSWLFSITGMLSRLGAGIASLMSYISLASCFALCGLITALYVKANDKFHDMGVTSSLGVKMLAFVWTASACILLTAVTTCLICGCFNLRPKSRNVADSIPEEVEAPIEDESSEIVEETPQKKRRFQLNLFKKRRAAYDETQPPPMEEE